MKIEIQKQIADLIAEAVKKIGIDDLDINEIQIDHPADTKFGDYSTNIAMILAKELKKNPNEIAKNLVEEINNNTDFEVIEKVELAGVGFINFYLKTEWLLKEAEVINYEVEFKNRLAKYGLGKTMIIDYSAPNIAKSFGIGHLRSTNIGQALYNIYRILGWKTIGDNHLGDWGTQFGKQIVAIKRWCKKDLNKLTINDLEELYVKFHDEAEKDPSLVDEGREWFKRLENKDPEARDIWQKCIDISLKEFNRVYDLIDVKIDMVRGESYYEDMLPEVIAEVKTKGVLKESQGALIFEYDSMPPAIFMKTNGTTIYMTRDMATIKDRVKNWRPDLIIYEVGIDQALYFKQLFAAAEMMGWVDRVKLVHVGHGLISTKDGKFSTRKGKTIHLEEVIDKALKEAKKVADRSQIIKDLDEKERSEMIKEVGIGAIKFNDLKQDPKNNIIFDWHKIMSLEGDSGPYLQYTYARCQSVLRKTGVKEQKNVEYDKAKAALTKPEELALLKEFYRFEEKITEASIRFSPAVLAEYLLSVARKYNKFYGKYRIIDQPEEDYRIFLTKVTASIISIGLKLLGIKPIEKM